MYDTVQTPCWHVNPTDRLYLYQLKIFIFFQPWPVKFQLNLNNDTEHVNSLNVYRPLYHICGWLSDVRWRFINTEEEFLIIGLTAYNLRRDKPELRTASESGAALQQVRRKHTFLDDKEFVSVSFQLSLNYSSCK